MTTFANGESGLSVRTKINNVLQHADGTAGELVINEAGADVDFRVESDTNANALFVDGATGNVGIGVTPQTWQSGRTALQIGATGSIQTYTNLTFIGENYYADAAGTFRYITNGAVGAYGFLGDTHTWYSAPSGTAGSSVALSEKMRLDSSGNVGIGTSAANYRLNVAGPGGSGNAAIAIVDTSNSNKEYRIDQSVGQFRIIESGVAEQLILSSGNLGLGVTPSAWGSAFRTVDIGGYGATGATTGGAYLAYNAFYNSSSQWIYKASAAQAGLYANEVGTHKWYTAPSGTAGNPITFTQAMTLDSSGNLLIGTTSSGGSKLRISGLPTSSAGLSAGDVWNDGGTLKIA